MRWKQLAVKSFSTGGNFKSPANFDWKKIVDEMKMVV